jgi:hypothetical protein
LFTTTDKTWFEVFTVSFMNVQFFLCNMMQSFPNDLELTAPIFSKQNSPHDEGGTLLRQLIILVITNQHDIICQKTFCMTSWIAMTCLDKPCALEGRRVIEWCFISF